MFFICFEGSHHLQTGREEVTEGKRQGGRKGEREEGREGGREEGRERGQRGRKGGREGGREVRDGVSQGAWEIVKKGSSCHNPTHTYISTHRL